MPLIATAAGPVTPPAPPPVHDQTPLQITYIDPDGTVWPWSFPGSDGVVVTSVAGVGSPPVGLSGVSIPDGGELMQTYTAAKRQIVLGLHAYDDTSQAGLLDLIDRLGWALWTVRAGIPAPGTLQFARPGGTVRAIDVYVTSGPEQADTASTQGGYQWSTSYAITFQSALDPLLQDVDPVGPVVFEAPPSGGGVPPMPPVLLDPSSTLGSTTVVNSGGGDAYPIWTIYGPGTPTITNVTTGRTFGLSTALSSGEVVTVDTRPTLQSAVDGTGADRWGDLVKTSPRDLWTLVRGTNLLDVALAGSGTGSKVEMLYHQRWLRA